MEKKLGSISNKKGIQAVIDTLSDEDLLRELIKRNKPGVASAKTERYTPHSESIIGIGAGNIAHLTMDDEALGMLLK